MDAKVKDFRTLVRWLIDTYHGGVPYRMSLHLQDPVSSVHAWLKGNVRQPKTETLDKLCAAYNLDRGEVYAITYAPQPRVVRRKPLPIGGGIDVPGNEMLGVWLTELPLIGDCVRWITSALRATATRRPSNKLAMAAI